MSALSRIALAAIAAQLSLPVFAQYPDKLVMIVVPYAAGGAVDIVARSVGQPWSELVKQPVVVENRPGAGGNIGMESVAKAPPDGYTLLMASNAIATNNALFPKLAFDGQRPDRSVVGRGEGRQHPARVDAMLARWPISPSPCEALRLSPCRARDP